MLGAVARWRWPRARSSLWQGPVALGLVRGGGLRGQPGPLRAARLVGVGHGRAGAAGPDVGALLRGVEGVADGGGPSRTRRASGCAPPARRASPERARCLPPEDDDGSLPLPHPGLRDAAGAAWCWPRWGCSSSFPPRWPCCRWWPAILLWVLAKVPIRYPVAHAGGHPAHRRLRRGGALRGPLAARRCRFLGRLLFINLNVVTGVPGLGFTLIDLAVFGLIALYVYRQRHGPQDRREDDAAAPPADHGAAAASWRPSPGCTSGASAPAAETRAAREVAAPEAAAAADVRAALQRRHPGPRGLPPPGPHHRGGRLHQGVPGRLLHRLHRPAAGALHRVRHHALGHDDLRDGAGHRARLLDRGAQLEDVPAHGAGVRRHPHGHGLQRPPPGVRQLQPVPDRHVPDQPLDPGEALRHARGHRAGAGVPHLRGHWLGRIRSASSRQ